MTLDELKHLTNFCCKYKLSPTKALKLLKDELTNEALLITADPDFNAKAAFNKIEIVTVAIDTDEDFKLLFNEKLVTYDKFTFTSKQSAINALQTTLVKGDPKYKDFYRITENAARLLKEGHNYFEIGGNHTITVEVNYYNEES